MHKAESYSTKRTAAIRSIAMVAASLCAANAHADTVVSYFDASAGDSYDPTTGATISGANGHNVGVLVETGIAFTPAEDFSLRQIDLALSYLSGTNAVVVTLNSDNSAAPDPVLLRWDVANLPAFGTCCVTRTVTPNLPLLLKAGCNTGSLSRREPQIQWPPGKPIILEFSVWSRKNRETLLSTQYELSCPHSTSKISPIPRLDRLRQFPRFRTPAAKVPRLRRTPGWKLRE